MANGHGGPRAGAPGKAYPNRLDMNSNKQPQVVATGQKFGAAAEQKRALAAMPLPQQPPPPVPGQVVDLFAPSQRPNEPVTAGADGGPGVGSAAMAPGAGPVDQDLIDMAKYLPTLELMAQLPGASVQTRNWVRKIRGSMPPGAGRQ